MELFNAIAILCALHIGTDRVEKASKEQASCQTELTSCVYSRMAYGGTEKESLTACLIRRKR